MTGRNRNQVTKLETTIEQCRGEGKWHRVIELADELKSGYPQVGESYIDGFLLVENQFVLMGDSFLF